MGIRETHWYIWEARPQISMLYFLTQSEELSLTLDYVHTRQVMPNLVPPLTEVEDILAYRNRLQALEPNVDFLMSLYLTSSTTPQNIIEAKKAGVMGVKSVSGILATRIPKTRRSHPRRVLEGWWLTPE